ncbi:unnamed protein product, partial [Meganyctiphanes norvegica]
ILKAATVPGLSHTDCQTSLRKTALGGSFNLHKSSVCAGGNEEDACEGDGGSPLVCPKTNSNNSNQYVQMGIVAWGIGCGIPGNPGVYTSIPETLNWINKTIDDEVFTSIITDKTIDICG